MAKKIAKRSGAKPPKGGVVASAPPSDEAIQAETQALLEASELRSIRMERSAVERDAEAAEDQTLRLGMASAQEDRGEKGRWLFYRVELGIVLVAKGARSSAKVEVTYRVAYALRPDAPTPREEVVTRFGELVTMFAVWPYWREFLQSSLTRMGLPPVTIPLLRHGMFTADSTPSE